MFLGALVTAADTEGIFEFNQIEKIHLTYDDEHKIVKAFFTRKTSTGKLVVQLLTMGTEIGDEHDRKWNLLKFTPRELKCVINTLDLRLEHMANYEIVWKVVRHVRQNNDLAPKFVFEQIYDSETYRRLENLLQAKVVDILLHQREEIDNLFLCFERTFETEGQWPVNNSVGQIETHCKFTFKYVYRIFSQILPLFHLETSNLATSGFMTGAIAFNLFRCFNLNVRTIYLNEYVAFISINTILSRLNMDQIPVFIQMANSDEHEEMFRELFNAAEESHPIHKTLETSSKHALSLMVNFNQPPGRAVELLGRNPINKGFLNQICRNFAGLIWLILIPMSSSKSFSAKSTTPACTFRKKSASGWANFVLVSP